MTGCPVRDRRSEASITRRRPRAKRIPAGTMHRPEVGAGQNTTGRRHLLHAHSPSDRHGAATIRALGRSDAIMAA
ncbi:MAG: hypothetical protein R2710_23565 [Acidimicrobiales bacterium]